MNSVWRRIFFYLLVFLLYASSSPTAELSLGVKSLKLEPAIMSPHTIAEQSSITWVHGSALAGTVLLVPLMSLLGALIANPQWLVVSELTSIKSKISYIDHTTSQASIPLVALFALLGTAPLWGVLLSEGLQ